MSHKKTILAYNLITTYPVHGKRRSQLWSWSILNSQLVRGVKVINIANLPTTSILNNNFTGQNFLSQEFMLWFTFSSNWKRLISDHLKFTIKLFFTFLGIKKQDYTTKISRIIRACLHGGGRPRVGPHNHSF